MKIIMLPDPLIKVVIEFSNIKALMHSMPSKLLSSTISTMKQSVSPLPDPVPKVTLVETGGRKSSGGARYIAKFVLLLYFANCRLMPYIGLTGTTFI